MSRSDSTNIALNESIHRIRIPTPFLVGDVYCYLIIDEKIVMVDCGHLSDDTFDILGQQFKQHGLTLPDLDEIWITHGHPDHFGLASKLRDLSGALVFGHFKERNNLGNNRDAILFEYFFKEYGIPKELNEMMQQQLGWLQKWQHWLEPDGWVDENSTLSTGSKSFNVKHVPGHAPGHVAYFNNEVIFGGDVLISHISTNAVINFDPSTRQRNHSLLQQRASLEWMAKQTTHVLPGHGKIITNPEVLAAKHLYEQKLRYRKLMAVMQQSKEPMSLYKITKAVMPQVNQPEQTFLALSEVVGYLDWAIENNDIKHEFDDGYVLFAPVD